MYITLSLIFLQHFVSDRKVDEEIGRTMRFTWNPDPIEEVSLPSMGSEGQLRVNHRFRLEIRDFGTIFLPACGSNWGCLGFSRNQDNHDSSGGYVICIHCGLSMKINMCEKPHAVQDYMRRSWPQEVRDLLPKSVE